MSTEDFSVYRNQRELFLNCSNFLCVNIPIHDDTVLESEETFYVSVELGTTALRTNISLNETQLQVTILDNEAGKYLILLSCCHIYVTCSGKRYHLGENILSRYGQK